MIGLGSAHILSFALFLSHGIPTFFSSLLECFIDAVGGRVRLALLAGFFWWILTRARWALNPPVSPDYISPKTRSQGGSKPTALVTGCGRGVGRHLAKQFFEKGYNVIATDINEAQLASLSQEVGHKGELGQRFIILKVDVTKSQDWEKAYGKAQDLFGRVDVHCNNAGYLCVGQGIKEEEKEIEQHMNVNVKGMILGSQFAARHMMEQRVAGHIINTASLAVQRTF